MSTEPDGSTLMKRRCGWNNRRSGAILFAALTAVGAFFHASTLPADPLSLDCTIDWHVNDPSLNLNGPTFAATVWDSDGAGPLADRLYLGGSFTTAGGSPAAYILSWDGRAIHTLSSGMDARVLALTAFNGNLIASGDFSTAGGTSCHRIGLWDGSSWQALGTGINGTVAALTVYNGALIAGGLFSSAGGVSANNIAKWDGNSWSAMGSGMGGSFPFVQSLTVYGDKLIAGGSFTTAGGAPINYIAQWDGSSWQALGSGISGFGYVSALGVYNGDLVAGGQFPAAGSTNAHDLALWDGSDWISIGRRVNAAIATISVYNGKMVIGGNFTTVADGTAASKIAFWDGANWSPLTSGTNTDVQAVAVYHNDLIVGGQFTVAGGNSAGYWSRWGPAQPTVTLQPSSQGTCEGSSAQFTVAATGVGSLSYQWRRGESVLSNGGQISGADTATLTVNPAGPADTDSAYNCVIVDSCGGLVISQDAGLALTDGPAANTGGPYSGCETAAVSLGGTANNAASVSWSSSGTGTFTDGDTVSASYLPSEDDVEAGSVTLTLTAAPNPPCAAPATSQTTLTLVKNPTADAGGPYATCDV
ncbi:MAG TPA: immunoglobulin domain-containing protein, partial [Phycisphaerae bacterium]|nr:immunoglobulin domain-containing protein [Phycisphaerae bacterium]